MNPILAETLAPFLGIVSVAGAVLIGMKLRYNHLAKIRQGGSADEVQRLAEAVETLNDNMRLLRDEVVDLSERVDFAERMLPKSGDGEPHS